MAIQIGGTTVINDSKAITNVVSYSGDGVATQGEAEAGTNNDQLMTPLRVKQAIEAMAGSQTPDIQTEGWPGTDKGHPHFGVMSLYTNTTGTFPLAIYNTGQFPVYQPSGQDAATDMLARRTNAWSINRTKTDGSGTMNPTGKQFVTGNQGTAQTTLLTTPGSMEGKTLDMYLVASSTGGIIETALRETNFRPTYAGYRSAYNNLPANNTKIFGTGSTDLYLVVRCRLANLPDCTAIQIIPTTSANYNLLFNIAYYEIY